MLTIQPIPKRSSSMPKLGDQKVRVRGILTCPPSAKAVKTRLASAWLGTATEREKPWKVGFSAEQPSDAMTVVLPTRKLQCMILFSNPGGTWPGGELRALLEAHHHLDLGAERFAIEFHRLFASPVEEEVNLNQPVILGRHN
jgi:hypothetical protein